MLDNAIPEEIAHVAELGHPDDCTVISASLVRGTSVEKLTVEQATEFAYLLEEALRLQPHHPQDDAPHDCG